MRSAALVGASFIPVGWSSGPSAVGAAPGAIDPYTDSDANVSDLWTDVIAPTFETVHPQATINVVIARLD